MKDFLKDIDNKYGDIRFYSYFDDSKFVFDHPEESYDKGLIDRKNLGDFHWDRGAKTFALKYIMPDDQGDCYGYEGILYFAKAFQRTISQAQDFMDALACLGEKEIRKRIKDLSIPFRNKVMIGTSRTGMSSVSPKINLADIKRQLDIREKIRKSKLGMRV